jgi:hypothetical protein
MVDAPQAIILLAQCSASLALWMATIVQDLKHREISVFVLAGLALVTLVGRSWYWWVAVWSILLFPWRRATVALLPSIMLIGGLSRDLAPALALVAGVVAWAGGWWGGADTVALFALGMRYGTLGLIAGSIAAALGGIVLMIVRGRSLWALVNTLPQAIRWTEVTEIPDEAEIPAAAVLGVVGIVLELMTLGEFIWT